MSAQKPENENWLLQDPPEQPPPPSRLMTGDPEVANAIRLIAVIMRDADANAVHADLRKAAVQGKTSALLDYLSSDGELGAMLAELLAGELGQQRRRPPYTGFEIKFCCDAIEAVRREIVALKAKGEPEPCQGLRIGEVRRDKAIKIIADRIGRTEHDLRHWLNSPGWLAEEMRARRKSRASKKIP